MNSKAPTNLTNKVTRRQREHIEVVADHFMQDEANLSLQEEDDSSSHEESDVGSQPQHTGYADGPLTVGGFPGKTPQETPGEEDDIEFDEPEADQQSMSGKAGRVSGVEEDVAS